MIQRPYRLRSNHLSSQIFYIPEHRYQFKNSYTDNSNTTKYSRWITYDSVRNKNKTKLEELLKEYKSQFAQDETTTGSTPLTKMTIDTRDSKPVSQKPYPIVMKH